MTISREFCLSVQDLDYRLDAQLMDRVNRKLKELSVAILGEPIKLDFGPQVTGPFKCMSRSVLETQVILASIRLTIDVARRVFCATLEECRQPEPRATPDAVSGRLAKAILLGWSLETCDNFSHDFRIEGEQCLHDLYSRLTQEGTFRRSHYERLFRRFEGEFELLQNRARDLFEALGDQASEGHLDNSWPELIVDSCFEAALNLEAHYEARLEVKR
jgi:hypothetical protein